MSKNFQCTAVISFAFEIQISRRGLLVLKEIIVISCGTSKGMQFGLNVISFGYENEIESQRLPTTWLSRSVNQNGLAATLMLKQAYIMAKAWVSSASLRRRLSALTQV